MRNPKESWHLSDSQFGLGNWDNVVDVATDVLNKHNYNEELQCSTITSVDLDKFLKDVIIYEDRGLYEYAAIGPKDMKLAQTLIKAGSEHRKFMRQIMVCVDITAPLYWYKEYDTYKVGTVANSTSTMHKLTSKPITIDCFETDDYNPQIEDTDIALMAENHLIPFLEFLRQRYNDTNDKRYWKELVRWNSQAWLQTRTCTFTYENAYAMCSPGQRRFHKLTEWSGDGDDFITESFIKMARSLPYAQQFIFIDELKNS